MSRSAYGLGDRLLHRFALGSTAALEMSFDIEMARYGRALKGVGPAPVFVCGLARAGTTILMRAIHDTRLFATASYRDLPFALAPNSWAAMTRRTKRHVDAVERGHGDGVLHDLDSPEAIEEVFWRCFEGRRYIRPDGLAEVAPDADTIAAFRNYAALIALRYDRPRYLSKNNNNLLRIPALVRAFPDTVLLHPFRNPVQQAASLLRQHLSARDRAREDPFRASFMRWLGHHEFGADQRPFLVGGRPLVDMPDSLDYWLATWIRVYRHLDDQPVIAPARRRFVDFDAMCRDPAVASASLASLTGTPPGALSMDFLRPPAEHPVLVCDPLLMEEGLALHADLVAKAALPLEKGAFH